MLQWGGGGLTGGLGFWRDISVALLMLEFFVVGLPVLAVGILMVRLLRQAKRWLKASFPAWQAKVLQVGDAVDRYAELAVVPVVAVAATFSAAATFLRLLTHLLPPSGKARSA